MAKGNHNTDKEPHEEKKKVKPSKKMCGYCNKEVENPCKTTQQYMLRCFDVQNDIFTF